MDERHWVFVCDDLLCGVPNHLSVVLRVFRIALGMVVIVIMAIAMGLDVVGINSHEVL